MNRSPEKWGPAARPNRQEARIERGLSGTGFGLVRLPAMTQDKIYDEPGTVSADDGVVHLDGPDSVDVRLTIDAAEEISDRLLNGALKARGQIIFADKKRDPLRVP